MYTNVKANPAYREVLSKMIRNAYTSILAAEDRETDDKIMEDFPMLANVKIDSEEFNEVIDGFVKMMEDAVAYEDHETLPDDFIDNYQYGHGAMYLGLVAMQVFENQTGDAAFTCDEEQAFVRPSLKVLNGGKSDA